jgi:hypothetical protein
MTNTELNAEGVALLARWADLRERLEALPEDTPHMDLMADVVEWAADATAKLSIEAPGQDMVMVPSKSYEDGVRDAAKSVDGFAYSHEGSEDENTLVGMFARGCRYAKRSLSKAILALLPIKGAPNASK